MRDGGRCCCCCLMYIVKVASYFSFFLLFVLTMQCTASFTVWKEVRRWGCLDGILRLLLLLCFLCYHVKGQCKVVSPCSRVSQLLPCPKKQKKTLCFSKNGHVKWSNRVVNSATNRGNRLTFFFLINCWLQSVLRKEEKRKRNSDSQIA